MKDLLQQGLTVGTMLEHKNLPGAGMALQNLRPVGRSPSEWAIRAQAAACRTQSWSVGRKETTYWHLPTHTNAFQCTSRTQ